MIKNLPLIKTIETTKILKKSIQANRALAKLNGTAKIIPNQNILINSLVLQGNPLSEFVHHPTQGRLLSTASGSTYRRELGGVGTLHA
jgi:hypothetical protein